MNLKRVSGLFILSLLILSLFVYSFALASAEEGSEIVTDPARGGTPIYAEDPTSGNLDAALVDTGDDPYSVIIDTIHSNRFLRWLFGIVFGIWDVDKQTDLANLWGIKSTASGLSVLVVYILMWVIFLLFISDILTLVAPFSNPGMAWGVGAAFTIIIAQLQGVYWAASKAAVIIGWFGVASVWFMLAVSIVVIIALVIGTGKMQRWVVSRQIAVMRLRAMAGKEEAVQGLNALKLIGKETAEKTG